MIHNFIDFKCETEYLNKTCLFLEKDLASFDVYYQVHNHPWPRDSSNKDKIIFLTSLEQHYPVPQKYIDDPSVKFVFKHYAGENENQKVFPIPLPYVQGLVSDRCVNITERLLDFSFQGTVSPTRYSFFDALKRINPKKYISNILLYENWNNGYSSKQYSQILNNTKFALCPMGYVSQETFRFTEACFCGAIPITTPKPKRWFYPGVGYIEISDWSLLPDLLDKLLSKNDRELSAMQRDTNHYYDDYLSPYACSSYIRSVMND